MIHGSAGRVLHVDLTAQTLRVEAAKETYYRLAGWDAATGNPTAQRLRELGLEWAGP